ncbi:MAG: alanine racemase [Patescibacteria group bacterium]|mgnify:FL=1
MSTILTATITRVEINKAALRHNLKIFREVVGSKVIIGACVKANAYGHGLVETAKILRENGADWLCVNALFEAEALRKAGVSSPIYIMGYVMKTDLPEVINLDCRLIVYNKETVTELAQAAKKLNKTARIHIKVETGNNRQGVFLDELLDFAMHAKQFKNIEIEGLATHFANIEDITPKTSMDAPASGGSNRLGSAMAGHPPELASPRLGLQEIALYPQYQAANFKAAIELLEKHGIRIPIRHLANSAATLLFPKTHYEMVRPGIAIYGLWPSPKTKKLCEEMHGGADLQPVLSWKTRVAQIKEIPQNSYVGYGCIFKTSRKTRLAILPVGYYDGYDRGFSNKSHVLIHGKAAKVCGRICMNIMMVDITDIPEVKVEDTATLLGKDGSAEITADFLGELIGTINYEITTRISESIPRIVV